MRRIIPLSVLAAGAVMACSSPELTIPTTAIPTAGVRFVNAVPDTGAAYGLDFRFVDIVESNAQFRVPFRNSISSSSPFVATLTEYKGAQEGSRHFRIFLDDTIQTIASTIIKDSTFAFVATHNYTALLMGNSRSAGSDKMRLTILDENVPDPGTSIALRVVNTTGNPIDVSVYLSGTAVPATPTWASVPAFSASTYVTKPPGTYLYIVRAAGSATNLITADASRHWLEPLPGHDRPGSQSGHRGGRHGRLGVHLPAVSRWFQGTARRWFPEHGNRVQLGSSPATELLAAVLIG